MRWALAMALLGCSSTTTGTSAPPPPVVGSGHGTCVARKGTYVVSYAVRSGDCGDVSEQVEMFDQTAMPADAGVSDAGPSPCATSVTMTVDNCEVTYSSRCKSDGVEKGGAVAVAVAVAVAGISKWTVDGSFGTSIEQWTVFGAAGNTLCVGSYDVSLRRE